MLLKNTASQGVALYAYVIATGLPDTGDAANITGYYSLDGGTATVFATANPTELDATHMPGVYWQPLAQAGTNGNCVAYAWKSSTPGIAILPVLVLTTGVSIPTAAPGAANGQFIAGTNAATTITTSLTTHFVGTVDTVTNLTNAATAGDLTAMMKTSVTTAATAATPSLPAAGVDSIIIEAGATPPINFRQSQSLILAALCGADSGLDTGTIVIKGAGVATTRIQATGDTSGNRSAITLSPPT